jgi:HEAT repeat protein
MKGLTEESRGLLTALWEPPGLWDRVRGRSRWNLSVIEKLGQSGETAAIPHLLPPLISGSDRHVAAATRAIATLLAETRIGDLPGLDESMRTTSYLKSWSWYELEPRGLAWPELLSMHGNGYVREDALKRLGRRRDGTELPYLLLRVNDWVSQVRDVARDAVLDRIAPDHAESFVRCLPLVVRLQRGSRGDHREVLERITRLLAGEEARPFMFAAMAGGSPTVRRASFRILTAAGSPSLPEILRRALETPDPVIRLWAARASAEAFDGGELQALLRVMLRDPAPPVRQTAVRTWAARFPDESQAPLEATLLDRSPSVRYEVRFHLRGWDEQRFRTFYRDALASARGRDLRGAIAGLAETGEAEDANLLAAYLSHPLAGIRAITVRALMRLAGDQCLDLVLDRVNDVSSGVSGQARKAMEPHVSRIGASRLSALFSGSAVAHVRANFLRLMAALPKWDSIRCLVQAAAAADERVAEQARAYVDRWESTYNRRQVAPTPDQAADLEHALAVRGSSLPPATVESIRFALRPFSRR